MSQIELNLLEAMQKFMNFLIQNVFETVNNEIMIKMQIFNNLMKEKTVSLSEKAYLLLDYTKKLDDPLTENKDFFRKNSSSSTYFANSYHKPYFKTEIDNSSFSHETQTLTIESEKESFFSKPFVYSQKKIDSFQEINTLDFSKAKNSLNMENLVKNH